MVKLHQFNFPASLNWWVQNKTSIFFGTIQLLLFFFLFELQVEELEKEILDAREKNQFYRSKMQELVSFFSNVSFYTF